MVTVESQSGVCFVFYRYPVLFGYFLASRRPERLLFLDFVIEEPPDIPTTRVLKLASGGIQGQKTTVGDAPLRPSC